MKSKKAFTLIELLIVAAIIGILATVVVVNLSGAQNKAREGRMKSDLEQLAGAAEIIRIDNANIPGTYDASAGFVVANLNTGAVAKNITSAVDDSNVSWECFKDAAGTKLLPQAPSHPQDVPTSHVYYQWKTTALANSSDYVVYSKSILDTTLYLACSTGKACVFTRTTLPF